MVRAHRFLGNMYGFIVGSLPIWARNIGLGYEMTLKWVPALLCISILNTSCINLEEVKITEIKAMELIEVSNKGALVAIQVAIDNPNNYAIQVTGADLDVFVGEKHVGNAQLDKNVRIPANSSEVHEFSIKADYGALVSGGLGGVMNLLSGHGLEMHIKGDVMAKAFLFKRKIPVDIVQRVPLAL